MTTLAQKEHSNPTLAVDCVIRFNEELVLVYRDNFPNGWALPGGFVEEGETVEDAIRREVKEETNLSLTNLKQWKVFSDPDRDPRQHVVSVCFIARGEGSLSAGSDANQTQLHPPEPPWPDMAFDHEIILDEYVKLTS